MMNKKYFIYVKIQQFDYNINNLSSKKLQDVISAYNNGKESFFIDGTKYSMRNLFQIRIYEVDLDKTSIEEINSYKTNQRFSKKNILTIEALSLIGEDVTEDFIKGDFGKDKIEFSQKEPIRGNKVFIVHGHDNFAKETVARFLESQGLSAIILHEQIDGSKTIIEKIEKYTDVGYAIILYTPCDIGGKKVNDADLKPRARQNVVFEHGYLIGKLGRGRVCSLVKESVELPSDLSGVVYKIMDDGGMWKYNIAKEMSNLGYNIDMNKIK